MAPANQLSEKLEPAQSFENEQEYFLYLGAEVPSRDSAETTKSGVVFVDQLPTEEQSRAQLAQKVAAAAADTTAKRKQRLEKAPKKPKKSVSSTIVYDRNPDVIVEVLARANGICEFCGGPAPFLRAKDGSPYLEVHHRIQLAHDGDDVVENAVALCPNCHREAHYGQKHDIA